VEFLPSASSIPAISSFVAVLIAASSLVISILTYRQSRLQTQPLVTAEVSRVERQPTWCRVKISLKSRDRFGYKIESISVQRPQKARALPLMMGFHDQVGLVGYSGQLALIEPLPVDKATREISINVVVRESGTPKERIGPLVFETGDSQSLEFFVWLCSSRSTKLSLRVNLSRISEDERRRVITVTRRLPAAKSSAAD
jgi:hypothetical protein